MAFYTKIHLVLGGIIRGLRLSKVLSITWDLHSTSDDQDKVILMWRSKHQELDFARS
jgi:hypothetical protein